MNVNFPSSGPAQGIDPAAAGPAPDGGSSAQFESMMNRMVFSMMQSGMQAQQQSLQQLSQPSEPDEDDPDPDDDL